MRIHVWRVYTWQGAHMRRSGNSLNCQFSASFQFESETLLGSSLLAMMHKPTGLQKFCLYCLYFLRHTVITDSLTLAQLFHGFWVFSSNPRVWAATVLSSHLPNPLSCLFGWLIEFSFLFSFGSAHNWPQDGTRTEQALYHSAAFSAWSGYISNQREN